MPDRRTEIIRRRYSRIAAIYDFLEKPMELMLSKWRQELMKYVAGRILEVGVGTGKNLPHYPPEVEVTAIDFSSEMIKRARWRALKLNRNFDLRVMDAQEMEFPDNSFDTVVTSCVFCSTPDPVKGLKEIRRESGDAGTRAKP